MELEQVILFGSCAAIVGLIGQCKRRETEMMNQTCIKCPLKKVCKDLPKDMTCEDVKAFAEVGAEEENHE